jgi:hypothetical protein
MSLIITFMFEPAKLQMNWASASGARNLRRETTEPADTGSAPNRPLASRSRRARPRQPPSPDSMSPRSYASALAFSASNSACVIAPESSSSLAFAISAADPPPAVSRT